MSPSTNLEKARIINKKTKEVVTCMFNPKEYTVAKSNTWTSAPNSGKDTPQVAFGGGGTMTLSMTLFFDTYKTGGDVRDDTNKICRMMKIDDKDKVSDKGQPPFVEFQWGDFWEFTAVITSISQSFTLFRSNGVPVRATITVSFMQAKEDGKYPGQNPTTVVEPGYKRRVVKDGDSVDWIAFEEYGDASLWRFIAETNNIDDPKKLRPGQVIAIAPLPMR
jgi:nucleoid-associated protein YgaU